LRHLGGPVIDPLTEKRSALLIGVGHYANKDMLPALEGPQIDVRSMKEVLENSSIGAYDVQCLENVDSSAACTRIEEFLGSRSEEETVILFYSGHGFIDRKGALYLCTTNSSFATPRASSIRADFLTDLIDNCASKRVLMILDCCYSGNFEGAAKATSVIEPQFKGTGLGRVVLTAGASDQLAWDMGTTGSLFSRHIVNGLKTGEADTDHDGRITVQELYDYVYRAVTKEQPRQRPGKWTYREDGPSILIAQSPIQPTRELPADLLQELESDFPRARQAVLKELEIFSRRNAWARDPVIEKLRAALLDDSDSVKIAARAALDRLGGSPFPELGPTVTLPDPPPPARPAPPPVTNYASDPPPVVTPPPRREVPPPRRIDVAPALATSPPAAFHESMADSRIESDFPLSKEWLIWAGAAAVLPNLLMRLFTFISLNELAGFAPLLLTLLCFAALIALRYRIVDSPGSLVRRPSFLVAAAAAISFAFIPYRNGHESSGEDLFGYFIILGGIALAAIWKLTVRIRWGWTIPIAIATGLFGLVAIMLGEADYNDLREQASGQFSLPYALWMATYCGMVPVAVLLAAIARKQYLNSHGK
jgi:hypothetical protein